MQQTPIKDADNVGAKQQAATEAKQEAWQSKFEQEPKTGEENTANHSTPRPARLASAEDSSGTSRPTLKGRSRTATTEEADPDAISPEWAKAQVARFGIQGPLLHAATEKLRAEVAALLAKKLKSAKMAKLAKQAITNSLTAK